MARSKNNDSDTEFDINSDIDSDSDYQEDLDDNKPPPTTEDAFNKIFRGATTLPTRIRKKPQPYGSSPTPPPPPPHTSKKKNSKKKTAPLVNSSRTNQSNNNSKTKKRTRTSAKSSSALIAPAPLPSSSVAPLSSIDTNVMPDLQNDNGAFLSSILTNGALLSKLSCVEQTDHSF